MYKPNPIDTTNIELPEYLKELVELLVKNAHEIWARQRVDDGWKYGNMRDDIERLHPCLVPFEELEDEEKKYDRNAVVETIKCILKLGYEIKKKD